MPSRPYVLICIKCKGQFRSETNHRHLCIPCRKFNSGISDRPPRVFYKNRKIVLERDDYTCQCCGCKANGQHTNKINCHHIDVDRGNNSPSNLIALCTQCHLSLHNKYSKSELRRNNIYKLFAKEKAFGEFGKNLLYEPAKKIVQKHFKGQPKFFFRKKLSVQSNNEPKILTKQIRPS